MSPNEAPRWSVVAVTVICGVLAAAHIGKLAPALPALRQDLGVSMVTGGWIVSILSVMGVCLSIAAGVIGDRFGAARVLVAGLALCAVGGFWGAFSESAPSVLMSRMVEGLGFILIVVPGAAVIASAVDGPARRQAFGVWGSYMPVGTTLTIVLAPVIIAAVDWRGLWIGIAIACLVWLWPVVRFLDVSSPRPAIASQVSLRNRFTAAIRHPGVWLASLIFGAYAFQWIPLMIWLPTFLVEARGFPISSAAWLTGGVVVVNIFGNLTGGWLLRRGVKHWLTMFGASLIMGACAIGIFASSTPFPLFYGLCLMFSAGGGILPATALACGPLFVPNPEEMGAANGLITQGAHMGQAVGPPLLAALVTHFGGWHAAIWLMSFGAVTAIGMTLALARQEARAAVR